MISAHGQVVFVCKAGEVVTGDSCSGCERCGCEAQGAFTGMESQRLLTAHARTDLNAENIILLLRGLCLTEHQNIIDSVIYVFIC